MKREFRSCYGGITIPESETIRELKDDKRKVDGECREEDFHRGFPLFPKFRAEEKKYGKRKKSCCHIDDQSFTFRIAEDAKKDGRNDPRDFPTEKKKDTQNSEEEICSLKHIEVRTRSMNEVEWE
jgi:hypothetical protein